MFDTYTGKIIDVLNFKTEMINIEDIAHSLAYQCRFNGHCYKFYSIGEHSLYVCDMCNTHKLWGLLHDATECYISDIVRTVKRLPEFTFYRDLELSIQYVIADRFNLPRELPKEVKIADDIILQTELKELMYRKENKHIKCYPPETIEIMFLRKFKELTA